MSVDAQRNPLRLRDDRRIRLVVAGLGLAYGVFLFERGETGSALVVALISTVTGISCFADPGKPGLRRGSFLLVGALVFATYFLFGLAISISADIVERLGLWMLASTVGLATLAETAYAFRPSRRRRDRADRMAVICSTLLLVGCVGAAVYLRLTWSRSLGQ